MQNLKLIFYAKLLLISFQLSAQNNLIPNSGFEMKSDNSLFINDVGQPSFSQLRNWEIATHGIDGGIGTDPDDFRLMKFDGNDLFNMTRCGNLTPSPINSPQVSQIYAIIRANAVRCTTSVLHPTKRVNHGAIGVSLENNVEFTNGTSYTIRYRVAATRALNFQDDEINCDFFQTNFTHLRFFLSKFAPENWNNGNNSNRQELINANFQKFVPTITSGNDLIATSCDWMEVERNFTVNDQGFTTLVIYAESGGALLDEVEVFESCNQDVYVQNKNYYYPVYKNSGIEGFNFREKANNNLIIGNNVDSNKPTGKVMVGSYSFVNYTAPNEIKIFDGFETEIGAEVKLANIDCSTYYNRLIKSDIATKSNEINLETIPSFLDEKNSTKQGNVLPNPNNGNFTIINDENEGVLKSIEIQNTLGITIQTIYQTGPSVEINIQEQPAGLYLVKLNYTDKVVTKKVIKQ